MEAVMTVQKTQLPDDRKADFLRGMCILADILHQTKDAAIVADTWPVKIVLPVDAGNH